MSLTLELRCLLLCLCPCLGHKRNSIRMDTQQAHSTPILSVPGLWAMITYWSSGLLGLQHFLGLIKRVFWQHMSSLLDPMTCWQWCSIAFFFGNDNNHFVHQGKRIHVEDLHLDDGVMIIQTHEKPMRFVTFSRSKIFLSCSTGTSGWWIGSIIHITHPTAPLT